MATGLEIEGEDHIRPLTWEEWITLPILDQDESVHTVRGQIRVPDRHRGGEFGWNNRGSHQKTWFPCWAAGVAYPKCSPADVASLKMIRALVIGLRIPADLLLGDAGKA